MRNLIAFLWKHQFFVLFVLLEAVSVSLFVNRYHYHKAMTSSTVSEITGNVYTFYDHVASYFGLKAENRKLAEENAVLRSRLPVTVMKADTQLSVHDSLYFYIPAKVISTSVNRQSNYLLLNKGSRQGVKTEMGVLSSGGVAGIVLDVSPDFSYVMSLLHRNMRLSARIKKNNNLVNVLWDGKNYKEGRVVDIPSHIRLYKGDSIVTSGNSLVFPEGVLVGTVNEYIQNPNKDLSEAVIRFSTDFNSLRYVYVIRNRIRKEADSLIQQHTN